MSDPVNFVHCNGNARAEPYHYTGCGLDDIYLLSGFDLHETAYGKGVSIHNMDELHLAIGEHLIVHRKALSPKEFRFLRKNMDITQDALGTSLGVTGQTIARYEKGETEISGPADKLMRVLYAVHLMPDDEKLKFLEDIRAIFDDKDIDDEPTPAYFQSSEGGWIEAAAA